MDNYVRKIGLPVLLIVMSLFASTVLALEDDDTVLMKTCPGVAAWAKAHPHSDSESGSEADTSISGIGDPALRKELATRAAADTKVRNAWIAAGMHDDATLKAGRAVDADNLSWMKMLVARQGFPEQAQVGKHGVEDAWLLLQHADADPAFQATVLAKIAPRLKTGGVEKRDVALLTDRVLIAQSKSQRYGTQFIQDKDGQLVLRPTEDLAHVDQRRATMGLMPLADYRCELGVMYSPALKAKH